MLIRDKLEEFNALRNQLQEQHREQLHKLLKDFMPVLSKINKSVDEIFKHIQGEYEDLEKLHKRNVSLEPNLAY